MMLRQWFFRIALVASVAVCLVIWFMHSVKTDKTLLQSSDYQEHNQIKQLSINILSSKLLNNTFGATKLVHNAARMQTVEPISNNSTLDPQQWNKMCKPKAILSSKPHVNVINQSMETKNFRCVNLEKLQPTTKICIHDLKDDRWVSGKIAAGGFWEPENVKFFQRVLRSDLDMHAIDIGANIGEYSLAAAHLGRKVLAVEARLLHIHMLQRSLKLNGFHDRVTLVHNAVSDSYTRVELGTYEGNQGGTRILKANQTGDKIIGDDVAHNMTSHTILMSDLAMVANFTKAIMKIDIEGYEEMALRCSGKLFEKVFIPVIMMEWSIRKKPSAIIEPMLHWFQSRGYTAFKLKKDHIEPLDYSKWQKWPSNIILKIKK